MTVLSSVAVSVATTDYERLTRRRRAGRPVRPRQAAADRLRGGRVPPGPGHERRRGARAGPGLLRRAADPQGQGRRRHAHPARPGLASDRHGAARPPRARAQRRHVLDRPRRPAARRDRRARDPLAVGPEAAPRSTPSRRPRSAPGSRAATACTSATDLGVDVVCARRGRGGGRRAHSESSPSSAEAAELVRIESGRPRHGIDFDAETIPQEAGLNERAVSFTKGCYVGQETVARLYYKGKPNRHLRGLKLSRARVTRATAIMLGDKVVGELGSVAESPVHGPDRTRSRPPRGRSGSGSHGRRERRGRRGRRAPLRLGSRSLKAGDGPVELVQRILPPCPAASPRPFADLRCADGPRRRAGGRRPAPRRAGAGARPRAPARRRSAPPAALQSGDGVKTGRELTPVLRTLAEKLPALDGADRRRAERMLARPTQGEATGSTPAPTPCPRPPPLCGAHFCVHYVATTDDAPPAGDATATACPTTSRSMLRRVRARLQRRERADGLARRRSRTAARAATTCIDVYLQNIGPDGMFGYAAVDAATSAGALQLAAYLVMDNDYSDRPFVQRGYTNFLPPLQVTAAHEYNHVLQFNYDTHADTWSSSRRRSGWRTRSTTTSTTTSPTSVAGPNLSLTPDHPVHSGRRGQLEGLRRRGAEPLGRRALRPGRRSAARGRSRATPTRSPRAPTTARCASGARASSTRSPSSRRRPPSGAQANGFFEEGNTFPDISRALSDNRRWSPQDTGGNDFVAGGIDHTSYALVNIDPAGRDRLALGGSFRQGVGRRDRAGRAHRRRHRAATDVQIKRLPAAAASARSCSTNATKYSRVTAVVVNARHRARRLLAGHERLGLARRRRADHARRQRLQAAQAGSLLAEARRASGLAAQPRVDDLHRGHGGRRRRAACASSARATRPCARASRRAATAARCVKPRRFASKPRTSATRSSSTTDVTDPGGNPLPASRRTWRFTTAR